MGMSTHIVGFKDRTEHDKHLRVLEVCKDAGVSVPRETAAYLGDDSEGVDPNAWDEYEIEEALQTSLGACVREFNREMEQGYEIVVDSIPDDVKVIRVYNSY